ncbi:MAG: endolytic transglycosylase MltG [Proteobacteria bacterium]|nr:endolytic transglycosylase MltG [Pseudomonadota bacterium]
MKRFTIIFLIIIILILSSFTVSFYSYINSPLPVKEDKLFKVEKNDSTSKIIDNLVKEEVIKNKIYFKILIKIVGGDRNILYGYYLITKDSTPKSLWQKMIRGEVERHKFTVPEGYNIYQIAQIIENQKIGDKKRFLSLVKDKNFIKTLGLDVSSLEGYLHPATYFFDPEAKEEEIISAMVNKTFDVLKEINIFDKSPKDIHQILIKASLIEKEAKVKEEMQLISSVIENRLKKRMRLQFDPTVQYGLKRFDYNLTKKDLMTRNPYNTYVVDGLPPTPIANPSKSAILAAINPAKTDYLYFVAKNDGTHYFSSELKKHNKAVYHYQIKGKKGEL